MEDTGTKCDLCSGSGKCPACSGLGVRVFPGTVRIACSHCSGTGVCPVCGGQARLEEPVPARDEEHVPASGE